MRLVGRQQAPEDESGLRGHAEWIWMAALDVLVEWAVAERARSTIIKRHLGMD